MREMLTVHREDRAFAARLTAKARALAEAHIADRRHDRYSARRLWPLFAGDRHA